MQEKSLERWAEVEPFLRRERKLVGARRWDLLPPGSTCRRWEAVTYWLKWEPMTIQDHPGGGFENLSGGRGYGQGLPPGS